ncbi:MAG: DsbA family protein [Pseudomonadota bacterium]
MDRRHFMLATAAMGAFSGAAFAQETETVVVPEMVLGSDAEDAVTLVEYASFTCPHCKSFHELVWPDIKADYVDTGKIKFVNRELLRNRADLWAAMIARCEDGAKYFGIVDMLFKQQSEWTQGSEADIADNLRKIGLVAGFDRETVDACFSNRDFALALIEKTQSESEADGVTGTPTFFLNGERVAQFDTDSLKSAIDAALAAKG